MNNKAKPLTEAQWLQIGLETARHPKWRTYKHHTNIDRFRTAYGVIPKTCEMIWNDLRDADRINKKDDPRNLLLAIRFLWAYHIEEDLGNYFDIRSPKTVRKYCKQWVGLIQSLLMSKVIIPRSLAVSLVTLPHSSCVLQIGNLDEIDDETIFLFSIDGTHCPIEEPRPFSTEWSSHKFGGKPGVNYELGIFIHKPQLAWVYGPIRPGKYNDISTFRRKLKNKMLSLLPGKRLIGDKGYRGEAELISTRNDYDPPEIAEFKDRVLARHETFNLKLKFFNCLSQPFRHKEGDIIANHKVAFEACCTITQYQIETGGQSMFDPYPLN